ACAADGGSFADALGLGEGDRTDGLGLRTTTPERPTLIALRAELLALGVGSVAAIPLRVKESLAGTLFLGRAPDRPFSGRDRARAELLAEHVASHLEKARLHADALRTLDETRMLVDVGRAINASLDLEKSLLVSAEVLTRLVDASNAFVLLL